MIVQRVQLATVGFRCEFDTFLVRPAFSRAHNEISFALIGSPLPTIGGVSGSIELWQNNDAALVRESNQSTHILGKVNIAVQKKSVSLI